MPDDPYLGSCCPHGGAGGLACDVDSVGEDVTEDDWEDAGSSKPAPLSLDLDFPFRKMPGGTDTFRNVRSWSTVGISSRSPYEKYAVRCHFRAFSCGDSETKAE